LATFIAENNQRNVLFVAESTVSNVDIAAQKYQYFEIDATRFGGVSLDLKIQDTAGLQTGTALDWNRTNDGGAHARFWDAGPTLGDQSTYEANWAFVVPQDTLMLVAAASADNSSDMANWQENNFSCFSEIPKRKPVPFKSAYAEEDLDALTRGDLPDDALFKRVLVNNTTPLAAWLEDVGTSITSATLYWHNAQQKPEHIIPAQMTYTFTVQVTGGLDVKYGLTSPLWPTAAIEAAGTMQKTNTITVTLNGIEALDSSGVSSVNAINANAVPLPTIQVAVPPTPNAPHLPLPDYVGRQRPRGFLIYPAPLKPQGPPSKQ
jgi:hypothetical protein